MEDIELLQQYARNQSEEAFAALVSQHINLVYSTALRQAGNPDLAEEITQVVFIILARKAATLDANVILSAWLCRTARYTAANALTVQRRRQHHEQEAQEMQSILNEPEPNPWSQIAPLLDTALGQLREADQNAITLRFFENKSFSEVALALGASEDAAKMRVGRALEKLRKFFGKRGFTLSAAVIAAAVSANAVQAAPAGLAASVTVSAVNGLASTTSSLSLLQATLKLMGWMKAKTIASVAAGVILAAGISSVTVASLFHTLDARRNAIGALASVPPPDPAMAGRGSVAFESVMPMQDPSLQTARRMVGGVEPGPVAAMPSTPPRPDPAWIHVPPRTSPSKRTMVEVMAELGPAYHQFDLAVDDRTVFTTVATRRAALPRAKAAADHIVQLHREMIEVTSAQAKVGMINVYADIGSILTILKLALDDPVASQDIARAIAAGGDDAALARVLRAVADYFQAGQDPTAQLRAVNEYADAAPFVGPGTAVTAVPFLFSHNPPANNAVARRLVAVLQSDKRFGAGIPFIVRGLTDPALVAQSRNQSYPYFAAGPGPIVRQ